MLGLRGLRLAVLFPQLYEMQVRAIIAAALEVGAGGERPIVEVMLPLVAYETELALAREAVERAAQAALEGRRREVEYRVGTMIELPRACLIAGRIAAHADFFSFGTNDLTQTDDRLLARRRRGRLPDRVPEPRVDRREPVRDDRQPGVGRADADRGRARARRPTRISGSAYAASTAGDPDSIEFFERVGLDYVSCSPFRVPIARVASAQATAA